MDVIRLRLGTVNSYLIKTDAGSVLIDTGPRQVRHMLMKKLAGERIRLILLTHGHYDHVANCGFMMEQTGAQAAVSPADRDFAALNRPGSLKADTPFGHYLRLLADFNFRLGVYGAAGELLPLLPGNTVRTMGLEFEILPLPGHTAGSVGILLNKKQLFVGDAMMDFFHPVRAQLYVDKAAMLQSVERIRTSGVAVIYPGHGKPFRIENGRFKRGITEEK